MTHTPASGPFELVTEPPMEELLTTGGSAAAARERASKRGRHITSNNDETLSRSAPNPIFFFADMSTSIRYLFIFLERPIRATSLSLAEEFGIQHPNATNYASE